MRIDWYPWVVILTIPFSYFLALAHERQTRQRPGTELVSTVCTISVGDHTEGYAQDYNVPLAQHSCTNLHLFWNPQHIHVSALTKPPKIISDGLHHDVELVNKL
jgi:hypothetical protein